MNEHEWKPGDMAMLSGKDDGEVRAIWQGTQWAAENCRYFSDWAVAARPLVVIDPEDREQVERLAALLIKTPNASGATDWAQAALREFANPTPPQPDEPLGLGAVVEAIYENRFVHVGGGWVHADDMSGNVCDWQDIAVVRVLSEGVTP